MAVRSVSLEPNVIPIGKVTPIVPERESPRTMPSLCPDRFCPLLANVISPLNVSFAPVLAMWMPPVLPVISESVTVTFAVWLMPSPPPLAAIPSLMVTFSSVTFVLFRAMTFAPALATVGSQVPPSISVFLIVAVAVETTTQMLAPKYGASPFLTVPSSKTRVPVFTMMLPPP